MPQTQNEADEAFIQSIRRGMAALNQWKWLTVSVTTASLVGGIGVMITSVATQIRTNPLATVPPQTAYFVGMWKGITGGFLLYAVVHVVFQFVVVGRTWRIMLDYHDRLQQAGLLPTDSPETMKPADHEPLRS